MVQALTSLSFSFLVLGGIGVLFGFLLVFLSRVFAVKKDKRIVQLEKALPGVNCGICGYAGCSSYAEAIVNQGAPLTLCTAADEDTVRELSRIMGVEVKVDIDKKVAQVHCRGGKGEAGYKYGYDGIKDCNALFLLFGGNKICEFGCLGLGSCIAECPVDAIDYDENGLVRVDREICIGCGKCIDICPTGVMQFVPYDADVFVACNSKDNAKKVKTYCSVGCIGCKICEKKSPEGGFFVEDNLARIDYTKKGDRIEAMKRCPVKCIIKNTKD